MFSNFEASQRRTTYLSVAVSLLPNEKFSEKFYSILFFNNSLVIFQLKTAKKRIFYNNLIKKTPMQTQPFKKRYNLQQRIEKSKKQMASNPGKIVIIVEKISKSTLPIISNPRFLCEKDYKFSAIKNMLQKKIKESGKTQLQGKNSFFVFVKGTLPNPETTMSDIYAKYKDEDGFLYLQYSDQESL